MRFRFFSLLAIVLVTNGAFANADSVMISRIYQQSFYKGEAYENLRYLTKNIGHRISGSSQAAAAVQWSKGLMQQMPFNRVYLQDVKVPYWNRGAKEQAVIVGSGQTLNVLALGGSIATPEGGIEAEVIEVELLSDLRKYGAKVRGKIVFVNKPWNESLVETGIAYGLNSAQRSRGPSEAAKLGAVAYLFRSLGSGIDDYPHTGATRYTAGIDSIPAMAISAIGANTLSAALKHNDKLRVFLQQSCAWKGEVSSHNVIGEWTGTEYPEQVITIGGHLDSWDVGEGAHDNGTGIMGTLDAIKTLMELGYKPKHTIRLVFYMNEENGVHGASQYGLHSKEQNEDLIAAIESDAGGFAPRGFDIKATQEGIQWIQAYWKPLFEQTYWVSRFLKGNPGVDSGVWGKYYPKALMFNFRPDPHRYFDLHHTDKDVFEAVDKRELQSGVAALASLLYLLDSHYHNIPN